MSKLTETIVLGIALLGLAMCMRAATACTPKAVDCRVEFLHRPDAGVDAGKDSAP